jgi:D-amino-acid dehydrogenase
MTRVAVIGAGVVGLMTAYYARQQGFEVTVIEKNAPRRDGSSFGNAGIIVPSHIVPLAAPGVINQGLRWLFDAESPFYVKPRLDADLLRWGYHFWRASTKKHVERSAPILRDLNLASKQHYQDLTRTLGADFQLTERGLMMLCNSDAGLEEEAHVAAHAETLGMAAKVLTKQEVQALEPELALNIVGAVYFPEDAHLNPGVLMHKLQQWLEDNGVRFVWNRDVIGVVSDGRKVTRLQARATDSTSEASTNEASSNPEASSNLEASGIDTISADAFVLCAGSWSPKLAKALNLRLPVQAGKGYSMTLSDPPIAPRHPAILSEAKVAVTPFADSLRVGGTMEIAGINHRVNPNRVSGIIKSACQYYPKLTPEAFRDVPVWHGLRPCSPDGLPFIGKTRQFDNVIIATGHAMMGLSLAPITGKLVSEVLAGEMPTLMLEPLSPDRFTYGIKKPHAG